MYGVQIINLNAKKVHSVNSAVWIITERDIPVLTFQAICKHISSVSSIVIKELADIIDI